MKTFDFGENWLDYSRSINQNNLIEAKKSLEELIGKENFFGDFLDIGCGSGLFSIAAKELGFEKVVGIDISDNSIKAAKLNKEKFFSNGEVDFFKKSILNEDYASLGKFNVVYSWGVLHHTGDMYKAIKNAMDFVKINGLFVISIYNRHWSSLLWKKIKFIYNISPNFIKKIMVFVFYIVIFIAKFLVTFRNPFRKKRGMSFYYDVVDWVGGYPYEYASKNEIVSFFSKNNFKLVKYNKAIAPTGCNEFVFKK